MRSGKLFSVFSLMLLVSLTMFMVGCGDDDPTNTRGSLTDPQFMVVQDQVNEYVDSTMSFVMDGFKAMTGISTGGNIDPIYYGPVFPDSDNVSVTYVGGWHVANVLKSRNEFQFSILDSVQFYTDGQVSQLGNNADTVYLRHQWEYVMADTTVSNFGVNGFSNYDLRNLQGTEAFVDGSQDLEMHTKFVSADSTVWYGFTFSSETVDLVIPRTSGGWTQSCPSSGTISATIEVVYQKDGETPITSNWDATISFNEGVMAVSIISGTTVWTYSTDYCIVPAS